MNSKSIFILFLFLLWGAGSTYLYTCKIKGFCQPKTVMATPKQKNTVEQFTNKPVKKLEKHGLIYFLWGKIQPHFSNQETWKAEVKSLKDLQIEGKKLRIEAPYYQDEPNSSGFDNLGIARAEALKKSLASEIDTAFIITRGKLITPTPHPAPEFVNVDDKNFKWITYNDFVQEEQGKTLIHFPYNSTREIKNKAVLDYLKKVALNLKSDPQKKVLIIGYTDNIGNGSSNKVLGMKRANRVKNMLIKNGVAGNQIIVQSEGKNKPIANNNTKEGRQKNRRVEISYIKK